MTDRYYETVRMCAFHEAGHAIAALLFGHKLDKVHIDVKPSWFGDPSFTGVTRVGEGRKEMPLREDMISIAAGAVAESMLYAEWGYSKARASSEAADHSSSDQELLAELAPQTTFTVAQAHDEARNLLVASWPRVTRIAEEIARYGTVPAHRLSRIG